MLGCIHAAYSQINNGFPSLFELSEERNVSLAPAETETIQRRCYHCGFEAPRRPSVRVKASLLLSVFLAPRASSLASSKFRSRVVLRKRMETTAYTTKHKLSGPIAVLILQYFAGSHRIVEPDCS